GETRTFSMRIYEPLPGGGFRPRTVTVDDRFFVRRDGELALGSSRNQGPNGPASILFATIEKLFASNRANPDYAACELAYPTDVWQMAYGNNDGRQMIVASLTPAELAEEIRGCRANGHPFCMSTYVDGARYRGTDLAAAHVYAVTDLVEHDGKTF